MRVLILSQYYHPEPVPKPLELAQALTEYGHTVSVITGFPNYPSGNLYDGYRLGLVRREIADGIPVTRTYEYPYHGTRAIGRVLNYLSFMLSAPLGSFFSPKCDAIYVWHPPLTVGVAAWIVARLRRVPFVYDVQDIWPDSVVLSGLMKPGTTVKVLSWLEKFVYRRASHILVVTNGARDNLIRKGVPPEKVTAMPHWIDEQLFQPGGAAERDELRAHYQWQDRFVVLFAGNLGMVQGLETVVRAADRLAKGGPALIVLVGDGTDKARLESLANDLGVQDRLQFIDRQPMESMPAFMSAADALLVHLKRSELTELVIPTKTMAYLAAGKPILMAMNGAAADLVEESQAGAFVEPEDPTALAAAIEQFSRMPPAELAALGENGRQYLVSHLSKSKVIKLYEEVLSRVAQKGT
ncbi:MAG: glycosyltransferase family 4 protein [Pyrinomonadaceae bacterium]